MNLNREWTFTLRYILLIGGASVVLLILSIVFIFSFGGTAEENNDSDFNWIEEEAIAEENNGVSEEKTDNSIIVDVKGAVENPGVYKLKEGDRVQDALETAGGWTDEADEYQLNLAERGYDEMVIWVPAKGEEEEEGAPAFSNTETSEGTMANNSDEDTVNINSADESELSELPGIGPAKAEAILGYREENGSFSSPEELTEVPGIGEKTFETLKEQITAR